MPTTIQTVNASDTLEVGRQKFNANDEALKATADANTAQQAQHVTDGHPSLYYGKAQIDTQQSTQDAALTTHKTSADHDARYMLGSMLSSLMRLTLDQIVDGIKTFVQNIKIKKANPAVELQHSDGSVIGKFYGEKTAGKSIVRAIITEASGDKTVLEAVEGDTFVNFPNHDVKIKDSLAATQAYVDSKLINGQVSGSFSITEQIHVANYNSADPIYSTIEGNRKFNGLPECKLIGLHIYRIVNGTLHVGETNNALNIAFSLTPTQKQTLFVSVARGIDFGGMFKPSLSVMRRTYTINSVTDEEVASSKGGYGNSTLGVADTDDWFITLIFQIT